MISKFKLAFALSFSLLLATNFIYSQSNEKLVQFENLPSIWSPKGYSQVAIVELGNSKMLIISGQIPFDSIGNLVGKGNLAKQTEQVFLNMRKILLQEGGKMSDLIKLGIFLSDISQLQAFRDVRNKFINLEQPPASTVVQVSKLFRDDVMLEVEAMAMIPKK